MKKILLKMALKSHGFTEMPENDIKKCNEILDTFYELSEPYENEIKKYKQKRLKEIVKLEMELSEAKDPLQDYLNDLKKRKHEKRHDTYMWITICPKKDDLKTLKKYMEEMAKWSKWENFIYCYEQRGVNGEFKGFHSHFLAKRKMEYTPAKCKYSVVNKFKKICNVKCIDVQKIGKDFAKDKIDYMLGKKNDEKSEKQDNDILWRRKNNLKKYYSNYYNAP